MASITSVILIAHLLGALATIIFVIAGIIQIISGRGNIRTSKYLAFAISTYQIISGALLIVFNPAISIQAVCIKGFALVAVIVAVHFSLVYRLKSNKISIK